MSNVSAPNNSWRRVPSIDSSPHVSACFLTEPVPRCSCQSFFSFRGRCCPLLRLPNVVVPMLTIKTVRVSTSSTLRAQPHSGLSTRDPTTRRPLLTVVIATDTEGKTPSMREVNNPREAAATGARQLRPSPTARPLRHMAAAPGTTTMEVGHT